MTLRDRIKMGLQARNLKVKPEIALDVARAVVGAMQPSPFFSGQSVAEVADILDKATDYLDERET